MTSTVLLKRCVVGLTKSTMPRMMQPQTAAIVNQTFDTRYSYKSCYEKLKVGVQQELLFSQNYIDMEKVNKLMQIKAGNKILTIAGNGTHALSKLLVDPEQVIALDVDAPALHMAKLQATGMELLSRKEFCSLIGINRRTVPPNERLKIYEHIRLALEPETAAFWDRSLNYIKDGLLYCGLIDQTVTAFSDSVLPLIHDNSTIQEYLALGNDMKEQLRYHEEIWNSEIWRKEYMIMRNKNMSTVSGPMEDINYGLACLRQYDRVVRHVPNNKNVFLETLLTGDITGKCQLHAYLRDGNYEFIKERLDKITWIKADVEQYIKDSAFACKTKGPKFDGINFSTAPLYMFRAPDKLKTMMEGAAKMCKPGSKLVYYALEEFTIAFPDEITGDMITYDGQDNTYCLFYVPTVATVI